MAPRQSGDGFRLSLRLAVLFTVMVGAQGLAAEDVATGTANETPLTADERAHWAYRPVERPPVPAVADVAWPRTAVDCFLLARMEAAQVSPAGVADRATLLRRVTIDLTGLPPTPAQIDAFLNDNALDAYERVVDRLLASPAYGERWAQHWLDLARFAETDGFELDKVRPNAWRYRDWVVEALNRDMPYDEFISLQLAGDLLRPDDPAARVATGFLLCGPDMTDINLIEERRHVVLNEMTGTAASVVLGLNLECAQCHDHKYDPLSQLDFYRFRAFFENADLFRDFTIATADERREYNRRRGERALALAEIDAQLKSLIDTVRQRTAADRERSAGKPGDDDLVEQFDDAGRREYERLQAARQALAEQTVADLPLARMMQEQRGAPRPAFLYVRGDFRRRGPAVAPHVPRVIRLSADETASGDIRSEAPAPRAALAASLTRPDHPLATRVIVNRLWQHHFGRGIAESPSNFGTMGDEPTHPLLLDWLAAELVRGGWSLKSMHRLMVTSAAYRQASRHASELVAENSGSPDEGRWERSLREDSENLLFSRMNRRRLEGEAIRDCMLSASGCMSQRRGGPGVRPPLPEELVSTLLKDQWPVTPDAEDHFRRSIYLFVRRNLRYPLFDVFDKPDTNTSCPLRHRSTTAPQALTMLNSDLSLMTARRLAGRILAASGESVDEQVEACFVRALGRRPTDAERGAAAEFLARESDRLQSTRTAPAEWLLPEPVPNGGDLPKAAAMTGLCLAILNLNEFVYVD